MEKVYIEPARVTESRSGWHRSLNFSRGPESENRQEIAARSTQEGDAMLGWALIRA